MVSLVKVITFGIIESKRPLAILVGGVCYQLRYIILPRCRRIELIPRASLAPVGLLISQEAVVVQCSIFTDTARRDTKREAG